MERLKDMSIGKRLFLGYLCLIIIMVLIGLGGYVASSSIQKTVEGLFNTNLPALDALLQADRDFQQLLVAERTMIFTNVKSPAFKELRAEYDENLEQAITRVNKYKAFADSEEENEIFENYEKALKEWKDLSSQVVQGRASDTREGRSLAIDLTIGEAGEKFNAMRDYIDQLEGVNFTKAEHEEARSAKVFMLSIVFLMTLLLIGIGFALYIAFTLSRGITVPMGECVGFAKKIEVGNLTETIETDRKDEAGQLINAMRKMAKNLTKIVSDIQISSVNIASSSDQVLQASQSLSQGATEQASSLEEISSSLSQINSQSRQNAENALQANSISKTATEKAQDGNSQMKDLLGAMKNINSSSDEIKKVVKVIDDIAFQINLLALNANVEAARAGKYGKGFAVVADEVRNLAVRSANAVKETTSMVEDSIKNIDEGYKLAEVTAKQLDEIVQGSSKVAAFLEEISLASKEQAQGIEQINEGLDQIDQVTQTNTANAEESSAASEELASQARSLKEMVSQFRIRKRIESNVESGSLPKELIEQLVKKELERMKGETAKDVVHVDDEHMTGIAIKEPDKKIIDPKHVIKLDDDDFDEF